MCYIKYEAFLLSAIQSASVRLGSGHLGRLCGSLWLDSDSRIVSSHILISRVLVRVIIGISTSFFVQQVVLRIRLSSNALLGRLIARTFVFLDTDPFLQSNPTNDIASSERLLEFPSYSFRTGYTSTYHGESGYQQHRHVIGRWPLTLVSRLALWVILITYPSKNHSVIHIAKTAIVDDGRIAIATN